VNNSANTVNVGGNYPTFQVNYDSGIKLAKITAVENASLVRAGRPATDGPASPGKPWGTQPDDPRLRVVNRRYSIRPLEAGTTWSAEVYLQTYMEGPPVGAHRISYSIALEAQRPGQEPGIAVRGQGLLDVIVLPPSDLAPVILGFAERYGIPEGLNKRESEEALSIANTPLVLPYLRGLVKYGMTGSPIRALAKFKGNSEAEELVVGAALENDALKTIPALSVLVAWDYPLKEADFGKLLSTSDPDLKDAALAYAEKINDLHYLSGVSDCVADPNLLIARDAKHVEDQLKERGEWR